MKYSNLMVDLETLGTNANAPIVQVGLWPFNSDKVSDVGTRILVNPSEDSKFTFSTIAWWMTDTTKEARNSSFGDYQSRYEEQEVCLIINSFAHHHCEKDFTVWGMPSAFDIPILESMYHRSKLLPPWEHWRVKCARTLFDAKGVSKSMRVQPEIAHDAMYDAKAQAETMVKYAILNRS